MCSVQPRTGGGSLPAPTTTRCGCGTRLPVSSPPLGRMRWCGSGTVAPPSPVVSEWPPHTDPDSPIGHAARTPVLSFHADQRLTSAGLGQCGLVRLLHFSAAREASYEPATPCPGTGWVRMSRISTSRQHGIASFAVRRDPGYPASASVTSASAPVSGGVRRARRIARLPPDPERHEISALLNAVHRGGTELRQKRINALWCARGSSWPTAAHPPRATRRLAHVT